MDEFKRFTSAECRPGGWNCPCCGPRPWKRAQARRLARHRMRAADRRERVEEVRDGIGE